MSGAAPGGEPLAAARIAAGLATARYGRSLRVLAETGSTNDDAREDALRGAADGHAVVADRQTSGRGSQGRAWASPGGQDLYVSIVARPRASFQALPTLTLAVGLGVADAVDALLAGRAPRAAVKWPNDVWLGRKKVSGILVEASTVGAEISAVIIGIGLNVNRDAFDGALGPAATSLRLAGGDPLERERALCTLLAHVEQAVDRWSLEGAAAILPAIEARLALRGEPATHDGAAVTVLGLAPTGAIRLRTPQGEVIERYSGRLLPV